MYNNQCSECMDLIITTIKHYESLTTSFKIWYKETFEQDVWNAIFLNKCKIHGKINYNYGKQAQSRWNASNRLF